MRATLVRGASGTLILRVTAVGLGFAISLILARTLGSAGYGAYAYAMSWVALLIVPATLGFENLLVREVAAYRANAAWGMIGGILHWTNRTVTIASVTLTVLLAVVLWAAAGLFEQRMVPALWVALVLIPISALTRVRQAAVQGLGYVVVAQIPEALLRPLLFISLLGGGYVILGNGMTAPLALVLSLVAALIALLIESFILQRRLPQPVAQAAPIYRSGMWLRAALPLMLVGGLQIVNSRADIIMIGAIKGAEATGVYAVASRGAELILLVILSANLALRPAIAELYSRGEISRLQRMVTRSARLILLFTLPIALTFIVFGHWFLLLFGLEFTEGRTALAILSAGQLFNAAVGSVGVLLIMTGYDSQAALGVGVAAVSNVTLNAALIPIWGIEGAAIATVCSLVIWNVLLAALVYKRLTIYPSVLGPRFFRRA